METERATIPNPEFNLIQQMISTHANFGYQNDDGLEVSNGDLEVFDLLIAALFLRLAQAAGGHVLESRTVN